MDVSKITDQVYIGGRITAEDWVQLWQQGVRVDVNLQIERQDTIRGDMVEGYLWLPVVDGEAPTLEQMVMGVHFIDAAVGVGKKVLVHCAAGVGRSVILCAAYLIATGMQPKQALEFIEEKRPGVGPSWKQLDRLLEFVELGIRLGSHSSHPH